MRSREKKEYTIHDADPFIQKNAMRMRLLVLVPEFQKDVRSVRKEQGFGIPENGFQSDEELDRWFQERGLLFHGMKPSWFYKKPPTNPFKDWVQEIGEKFNLPYNFYYSALYGVGYYILTDYIKIPANNWEVDVDSQKDGSKPRWVLIRAYAPLSNKEIREATAELRREQHLLMKGHVTRNTRVHEEFERDLENVGAWSSERGKPAKIKQFRQDSYLSKLAASGKYSKSQLKEWSKAWKEEGLEIEETVPSKITSMEIAGGSKKESAMLRQAKKRLHKLARELFGYGLKA